MQQTYSSSSATDFGQLIGIILCKRLNVYRNEINVQLYSAALLQAIDCLGGGGINKTIKA